MRVDSFRLQPRLSRTKLQPRLELHIQEADEDVFDAQGTFPGNADLVEILHALLDLTERCQEGDASETRSRDRLNSAENKDGACGEDDLDDGQGAEAQRDIVVPGSGDHHDVLCGSVGQLKVSNVI